MCTPLLKSLATGLGATQKVHKFLTLSIKQMHHPMKGHGGIDRRNNIIYFLHHKIIRRYSQRSINDVYVYKIDNTYTCITRGR